MADESTRRRPGRPALDEHDATVSIHVRVPSAKYDALYQRAQAKRVGVPELIRRALGITCKRAGEDM